MPSTTNYLPDVKNQYEALPYPARDPADETLNAIERLLLRHPQASLDAPALAG